MAWPAHVERKGRGEATQQQQRQVKATQGIKSISGESWKNDCVEETVNHGTPGFWAGAPGPFDMYPVGLADREAAQ